MPDDITKRISRFIEPFRVSPGSRVKLTKDFDPAFKAGIQKKKDGVGLLNDGISLLSNIRSGWRLRPRTASWWFSRRSMPRGRTGRSAT